MVSLDHLRQMFPLFRLKSVDIFFNGPAQIIYPRGKPKNVELVVASPGIFVIEKRQIVGYRVKETMGYACIKSIVCKGKSLIITGGKKTLELTAKNLVELSTFIVGIQESLFDAIDTDLSPEISRAIDDAFFVFDTHYPLATRFMSIAMEVEDANREKIASVGKILEETTTKLNITPNLLDPCLVQPLIEAVSLEKHLTVLELTQLNFNLLVDILQGMLATNSSITELSFVGIVYEGDSTNLVNFFQTSVITPISKLSFHHCELSSNKFTNFLLAFSKFRCRILSIIAEDCSFSSETIRAIFTALFQSPSFQFLRKFVLKGEAIPSDAQELFMKFKNDDKCRLQSAFEELHLESLKLNTLDIISAICHNDSHLKFLVLPGSTMKNIISTPIKSFHRIKEINISNAWVTPEALYSLFNSINRAQVAPSSIICNHIHMTEKSFSEFYRNASQLSYPTLKSLSWENNIIKDGNVKLFFAFIDQMPLISDFSLSNSLWTDNEESYDLLLRFVKNRLIKRFVMRGYNKTVFGPSLVGILRAIADINVIHALDITGQGVNDDSIAIITEMLKSSLKAVAFDEQQPTSASVLIKTLEALLEKNVEFATWPAENVKIAMAHVPQFSRLEVSKQFERLERRFVAKFNRMKDNHLKKRYIIEPSPVPRVEEEFLEKSAAKTQRVDFEVLDKVEDDIALLLNECFEDAKQQSFLTVETRQMILSNNLGFLLK